MAEPSKKAPALESFLEGTFGRTTAITTNVCIPAPVGCGKPVEGFRDAISKREYEISGLCQNCQDEIFGIGE